MLINKADFNFVGERALLCVCRSRLLYFGKVLVRSRFEFGLKHCLQLSSLENLERICN